MLATQGRRLLPSLCTTSLTLPPVFVISQRFYSSKFNKPHGSKPNARKFSYTHNQDQKNQKVREERKEANEKSRERKEITTIQPNYKDAPKKQHQPQENKKSKGGSSHQVYHMQEDNADKLNIDMNAKGWNNMPGYDNKVMYMVEDVPEEGKAKKGSFVLKNSSVQELTPEKIQELLLRTAKQAKEEEESEEKGNKKEKKQKKKEEEDEEEIDEEHEEKENKKDKNKKKEEEDKKSKKDKKKHDEEDKKDKKKDQVKEKHSEKGKKDSDKKDLKEKKEDKSKHQEKTKESKKDDKHGKKELTKKEEKEESKKKEKKSQKKEEEDEKEEESEKKVEKKTGKKGVEKKEEDSEMFSKMFPDLFPPLEGEEGLETAAEGEEGEEGEEGQEGQEGEEEEFVVDDEDVPGVTAADAFGRPRNFKQAAAGERSVFPDYLPSVDEIVSLMRSERAKDLAVLDMKQKCNYADYFVIATARSDLHSQTMGENILKRYRHLMKQAGLKGIVEGAGTPWVAVDVGSIVVHIFNPQSRPHMQLDRRHALHTDDPALASPEEKEYLEETMKEEEKRLKKNKVR